MPSASILIKPILFVLFIMSIARPYLFKGLLHVTLSRAEVDISKQHIVDLHSAVLCRGGHCDSVRTRLGGRWQKDIPLGALQCKRNTTSYLTFTFLLFEENYSYM